MKKILFLLVFSFVFNIETEAMSQLDSGIFYRSTGGNLIQIKLSDINERTLKNMSPEDFKVISNIYQYFHQVMANYSDSPSSSNKAFEKLRSSIVHLEASFMEGTEKDTTFLYKGYSKIDESKGDVTKQFDDNLKAIYLKSSNAGLCRNLAEKYKELAESSQIKADFWKAAFWFRMLYVVGEHSSYLDEYENMCLKGKQ